MEQKGRRTQNLASDSDSSSFTHDNHFNLTRVFHVALDLLGEVVSQLGAQSIIHFARFHQDADFTARLNGVSMTHAAELASDELQVFQALDVALEGVAAGPGAAGGQGVSYLDDSRLAGL